MKLPIHRSLIFALLALVLAPAARSQDYDKWAKDFKQALSVNDGDIVRVIAVGQAN